MADPEDVFENQMSVIEFLRRVKRGDKIPLDVTVKGLNSYVQEAEDSHEISEYVHTILRDRVTLLLNQQPVVQFIVNEIEYWGGPVLPNDDGGIDLDVIFNGLTQNRPDWYSRNINITS